MFFVTVSPSIDPTQSPQGWLHMLFGAQPCASHWELKMGKWKIFTPRVQTLVLTATPRVAGRQRDKVDKERERDRQHRTLSHQFAIVAANSFDSFVSCAARVGAAGILH